MKISSSFKVGLLTLIALVLLVGVVFRVKGRAFSSADRIEVQFKDVNGMRPGSGVQMMGLRVGQVEEITPVINGDNSYVNVKFVITEPDIEIPTASMFSIQQSGLIGELFLEITPPKTRTLYIPMYNKDVLFKDDAVQMKLSDEYYDVGKINNIEVVPSDAIPYSFRDRIKTKYAYKVDYIVNLPGLILPEFIKGEAVNCKDNVKKLRISTLDNTVLPYPQQNSKYTIIEPMRIADFMDWQYKAAESLTETNQKINTLLSDQTIAELKDTVNHINDLTLSANSTVEKVNKLLDDSRSDIDQLMALMEQATADFNKLSANINALIGDPKFKQSIYTTADSVDKMAKNFNKIMGNEEEAEQIAKDIRTISHNINEISTFVNSMTKDTHLKRQLTDTVENANKAMVQITTTLATVNQVTPENKTQLQTLLEETTATTCNLRKFSEKLNKRFLLFRLMF
ncbi:MAG: MCE family protein [Brachyspira sp.]|jgi:glr4115 protein|nr:MCE family protein [Brachyspira sp.]